MNKLLASLAISFLLLQFFFIRNLSGAENLEDNTSDWHYETNNDLMLAKAMLDSYKEQMKISEEVNKNLHKIISEQAKEIYEKEDIQIKIKTEDQIEKDNSCSNDSNTNGLDDCYPYIFSQSELLQYFNNQKSKSDEINSLHELLSQQAKEIEEKEDVKIKEKKESDDLLEEKIIAKYLLSLELKKKEQQLIEEQQKKNKLWKRKREKSSIVKKRKRKMNQKCREKLLE